MYQIKYKSNIFDYIRIEHENLLRNIFQLEVNIKFCENIICVNGKNKYETFIENGRSNSLKINCILSEKEFDYLSDTPQLFQKWKMKIELQEGTEKYYNFIWGTLSNVQISSFTNLAEREEKVIFESIIGFIKGIEAMKEIVRRN